MLKTVSFSAGFVSIAWFYITPGFEPILTLLGSIATYLTADNLKSPSESNQIKVDNAIKDSYSSGRILISAVETAYMLDRIEIIIRMINSVQLLTAKELLILLSSLYKSDRLEALSIVNAKLEKPISDKNIKKILKNLYITDRKETIDFLM